ncbi:MAG: hypothetical protein ACQEP1_05930 [Nanobdellota archaeon]
MRSIKVSLLVFVMLLALPFTSGFCEDLEGYGGVEVPGFIPYKNEVVDVYLNDTFVAQSEINNREVGNISCESEKESTLDVQVKNASVIEDIAVSDSPLSALEKEIGDGIKLEPKTRSTKIRNFLFKVEMKVASWFI